MRSSDRMDGRSPVTRSCATTSRSHHWRMSITEVTVTNLSDLLAKITPSEPDPLTRRRRDTGVYRGAADASWPLLTSLDTLGGVCPPHTQGRSRGAHPPQLHPLFAALLRHSPGERMGDPGRGAAPRAAHQAAGLDLLARWSPPTSPRWRDADDADRAVWRLDWKAVHRRFRLPELALLIQDLEGIFGRERPFTPWSLFASSPGPRQFACMIEPPSLDARIVTQAATFTLCSRQAAVVRPLPRPARARLGAHQVRHPGPRGGPAARPARSGERGRAAAVSRPGRPRGPPAALLLLTHRPDHGFGKAIGCLRMGREKQSRLQQLELHETKGVIHHTAIHPRVKSAAPRGA